METYVYIHFDGDGFIVGCQFHCASICGIPLTYDLHKLTMFFFV